jgi:hypothetical protein
MVDNWQLKCYTRVIVDIKEISMQLKGRAVEVDGVEDVDSRDYPDFCDAHFVGARFVDTGEELTDAEYEELGEQYADVLWEMAFESLIS